jgi:peptide/nickel transport system permease protein
VRGTASGARPATARGTGTGLPRGSRLIGLLRLLTQRHSGLLGLAVVAAFLLLAVLAGFITPYDPIAQAPTQQLQAPSLAHLLGTDEFGRDVLSRVLYGTQLSISLALASVLLGSILGVTLGLVAGYVGGLTETVIMRPLDGLLAFPSILTGIVIATILGPGLVTVTVAVAIINVPIFARLARASSLVEKHREYVLAARTIGADGVRIMVRHILPNCLVALITQAVLAMTFSVVLEASLSFLGLGAQRPSPSWGVMLDDSRSFLRNAPWIVLAPGTALIALLAGLTLLSDAITDALSPRHVERL